MASTPPLGDCFTNAPGCRHASFLAMRGPAKLAHEPRPRFEVSRNGKK
jgi:hypothetical protein